MLGGCLAIYVPMYVLRVGFPAFSPPCLLVSLGNFLFFSFSQVFVFRFFSGLNFRVVVFALYVFFFTWILFRLGIFVYILEEVWWQDGGFWGWGGGGWLGGVWWVFSLFLTKDCFSFFFFSFPVLKRTTRISGYEDNIFFRFQTPHTKWLLLSILPSLSLFVEGWKARVAMLKNCFEIILVGSWYICEEEG